MKKKLYILVFTALVALSAVSCDDQIGSALLNTISISIPSASVIVPYEGGTVSVRYTIGNAVDDGYIVASTEESWISDFDFSVMDTLQFFVAANTGQIARYADIELTYKTTEEVLATGTIRVGQEYNDQYVFNATYAVGQYYGIFNHYSSENIRQYSVYFSDMEIPEYGTFVDGATYYFIDFWTNADVEGVDPVSLPMGTYSFGQIGENWIISPASQYFVMNLSDEDADSIYSDQGMIVGGSINVARPGETTSFVSRVEDEWGGIHDFTYSGVLQLENKGLFTTLEGDEDFGDFSSVACEARYYGDYYQTGAANWTLCIYPETGTGFIIDISGDASHDLDGGLPEGTFTVSYSGGTEGTFLAGTVFNNYLNGTWLVSFDEEGALTAPYAPIDDGTIEIASSGDSYTITINGADDHLYNITASWTGTPTLVDYRTSTTAVKCPVASNRLRILKSR